MDPDFEKKVRDSFSRQGLMSHLGAEISRVTDGGCEIRLPYKTELSQQHGYFHAGATAAIADTAAGYASFSTSEPGTTVLTVEYKINLVAPAKGDELIARAKVIKSGRNLKITTCDVVAVEGGRETLCAALQGTFMILEGKADR